MKRLLLLLIITTLLGCSSDDGGEVPNRDLVVLQSTTFVSEAYEHEYEVPTGYGSETEIEQRRDVIRFQQNGNIEYFSVDEYDEIQPGTHSTSGSYQLDFPMIYDIIAVHIFDAEEVEIQKTNNGMYFTADGRMFEATLTSFE